MAIRIIGSSASDSGRVFKPAIRNGEPTKRIVVEGEPATGTEHVVDEPNNVSEPNANGETEFVDIGSIDTGSSDSQRTYPGKRRGRKPGSRNSSSGGKRSSSSTSKTTDSLAAMLFTVHSVAGALLKVNAVKIPRASCNDLAQAIMEVTELYDIPLLDEKGMALANLAAVACKVYIFNGNATVVRDAANSKFHVISDPIPVPDFMRG